MSFTIYEHVNKYNNKKYIGITSKNTNIRWGENGINYKSNKIFFNDILKYGWINFEHNILFSGLNSTEAKRIERDLILKYKTFDINYGYNIRISDNWSEDFKMKLKSIKTDSVREKQRKENKKQVYCDNKIFESVKSCATYYGVNVSTLSTWLNGYINMPKEYKEKGLKFHK